MGDRAVTEVRGTSQQLAVAEVRRERLLVEATVVIVSCPVSKGAADWSLRKGVAELGALVLGIQGLLVHNAGRVD